MSTLMHDYTSSFSYVSFTAESCISHSKVIKPPSHTDTGKLHSRNLIISCIFIYPVCLQFAFWLELDGDGGPRIWSLSVVNSAFSLIFRVAVVLCCVVPAAAAISLSFSQSLSRALVICVSLSVIVVVR